MAAVRGTLLIFMSQAELGPPGCVSPQYKNLIDFNLILATKFKVEINLIRPPNLIINLKLKRPANYFNLHLGKSLKSQASNSSLPAGSIKSRHSVDEAKPVHERRSKNDADHDAKRTANGFDNAQGLSTSCNGQARAAKTQRQFDPILKQFRKGEQSIDRKNGNLEDCRGSSSTPKSLGLPACQKPRSMLKGQAPDVSANSIGSHDNENKTPNRNLNPSFQQIKV